MRLPVVTYKAHAVDAHYTVSMNCYARDLSITSAFARKTTEHVVEIGREPGLATQTALNLATGCTDNEVCDFEPGFVRALGYKATLDRNRPSRVQGGELTEATFDDRIGAV